ncbi:deoxyribose-phosphate aldolase [Sitodiplosis mosellana]|uniref:deoxyribose-phosphate aldolase n=1 Tax=Sitodiplosis mosellana TaxID=263140 RepID=UPI0024445A61|nr:deoxyribose-phosphate aldolase [Sitodiplosis mosellana]
MVHASAYTPIDYSPKWLQNVNISLKAVQESAEFYSTCGQVSGVNEVVWAIKALQLTDLTTLAGDDTPSNVRRLCIRAAFPFTDHELRFLNKDVKSKIHTAAVCVYPSRVHDAYETLQAVDGGQQIEIAAVATGFPTGQYPLASRLQEIHYAIEQGATEIDIVIDRSLVLRGEWKKLYDEIVEMRKSCGDKVHMKTILAIGELGTFENVYKASMVAMMAGSDFIKTSTGKEAVNATLPVGLVMIRAIEAFYKATQRKIGFKPAGGVRTVKDAIAWMTMIKSTLGNEWLQPHLFRFGASGLLDDIEKTVNTNSEKHM